jgi:hypothetical protein
MKARGLTLILAGLLVLATPHVLAGSAPSLSAAELSAAIEDRAAFGLPSDPETIERIVLSGADAGSDAWGMVLTAAELKSLDLEGRVAFENAATDLIAHAESLPEFAGAYFDQKAGGQLTLQFTSISDLDVDVLRSLAPDNSREVAIVGAEFTRAQLRDALHRAVGVWKELVPDVEWVAIAVDERANSLRIEVPAADLSKVGSRVEQVSDRLGVAVSLTAGSSYSPAACTSRDSCYSPMKAGIRIIASPDVCTMGFHVTSGSNRKMVTAGHCSGAPGSPETWYHTTNVIVGAELSNRFGDWGTDIELVDINYDVQASHLIYGTSRQSHAVGNPATSELICASLRKSNAYDCGTVNDNYVLYTMVLSGVTYHLNGWDANGLAIQTGDSGSPMFKPDSLGAEAVAYGVVSNLGGNSALLPGNFTSWGVAINW